MSLNEIPEFFEISKNLVGEIIDNAFETSLENILFLRVSHIE